MIFFDTSVLVSASTELDHRHMGCLDALQIADRQGGACAVHTLAELFNVLSGRPAPLRMHPLEASRVVAHFAKRLTAIKLTAEEYVETVDSLAGLGHSGGMIYDALLLACARKAKATRIYTLHARHFRLIAPDHAARIIEP